MRMGLIGKQLSIVVKTRTSESKYLNDIEVDGALCLLSIFPSKYHPGIPNESK